MFLYHLLLFFTLTYSQSTIYIGILDDNDYPQGILNIVIPNITFCNSYGLKLEIQWINSSNSLADLIDKLELQQNQTNIYLERTQTFSTKLIQDFCQMHRIPFISMHSYKTLPITFVFKIFKRIFFFLYIRFLFRSFTEEYSVMPYTLRVLLSYLKYHDIEKIVYIYDNNESTHRIYELLKLMNNDEYFNDFSLDIRTIQYEDIYSLLYSIEIHSHNKERPPKYIVLDLKSYSDYEIMFNKISHMGLYYFLF